MKIKPKHIVIGGALGLVSIFLTIAYFQFQKMKEYCISVKKVKLNKFTLTNADIDLLLNFVNKSKLALTITSQEYMVYLNGAFVTKVSNAIPQNIMPLSTSSLAVKMQFNPQKALDVLKLNIVAILATPEKVNVKIASKIKVKFGIITLPITYDYNTNLKELMAGDTSTTATKC